MPTRQQPSEAGADRGGSDGLPLRNGRKYAASRPVRLSAETLTCPRSRPEHQRATNVRAFAAMRRHRRVAHTAIRSRFGRGIADGVRNLAVKPHVG
jgi:hypothetical protein